MTNKKIPELLRKREPLTPADKKAITERMKELGAKPPAPAKKGAKRGR